MPSNFAMDLYDPDLFSLCFFIFALTAVGGMNHAIRRSGHRVRVARRSRTEVWEMTSFLSNEDFHRTFRMSRRAFKELCDLCRPLISPRYATEEDARKERASHVAGKDIQTEAKIGLFLHIMAGGSFLDVHMLFGIGRSSAHRIFRSVIRVLLRVLPWQEFPNMRDISGFKDRAIAFALSHSMINPLSGCIAAVDGIQIQIIAPSQGQNPLHYFSRKGHFTLPCQALVDAHYRFIGSSILAVGSTHDNIALMLSGMYSYLTSDNVPKEFWVAGDEAYTCCEKLIIPFARSVCTPVHDGFNFFHSSHRVHVEQAFGILKKRWGNLQKPLTFDIALSTKIVPVAMKLHNFCINRDGGVPKLPRTRMEVQIAEERLQFWLTWCQSGFDVDDDMMYEVEEMSASVKRAENKSETRRKLVTIIRREGLRRLEFPPAIEMLPGIP